MTGLQLFFLLKGIYTSEITLPNGGSHRSVETKPFLDTAGERKPGGKKKNRLDIPLCPDGNQSKKR